VRTLLRLNRFWLLILVVVLTAPGVSQEKQDKSKQKRDLAEFIRANYTKYEYRIPMRDGARLFTSVYVPKDASPSQAYPILFTRTPYTVAPYGIENYRETLGPSEQLARSKYIFVYQDVRGRFMSEGEFVNMRPYIPNKRAKTDIDETSDAYDTIDWLVKNIPYNNGRVGMWGISYPGFYTAAGMIDAHPALKAASPQAPIADWFIGDDFHHNGALWLPHAFNFMAIFGLPRPELTTKWPPRFDHGTADGYNFFLEMTPISRGNDKYLKNRVAFWNEMTQHPNYDAFWKARNLPQHIKNIKPAILNVGGWFDAENLYGALRTYEAASKNSPASPVTLVMGPWYHGGWSRSDGEKLGDIPFGSKTSVFYRENIEFPFFEAQLKGKPGPNPPAAWVFQTGRNEWQKYEAWPPKQATKRSLYFGPKGRLSFEPAPAQNAFDQYISDPAKPVPFMDKPSKGMLREYMTADQRLQGRRTDVLVYQTEPLEEEVTFSGPIRPVLWVSTTGTDSDWVVKLIDVYPDDSADPKNGDDEDDDGESEPGTLSAYQQLVRGEVMRGRFRNSYEKPEPFEPGKPTKVEFVMPDVNHTFRRGHRIMIQVQSSWFPLADINPQKFVDIYTAKPEDFQAATQRVYRAPNMESNVEVLVLPKPAVATTATAGN